MSTEGKVDPMIGKRFGSLVVKCVKMVRNKFGMLLYGCDCDCGAIDVGVTLDRLVHRKTLGCSVCKPIRKIVPTKIGDVYGRLTIVKLLKERNADNRQMCMCKCSCGNDYKVSIKPLRSGSTQSCGCVRREMMSKRNYKHGHKVRGDSHGLCGVYYDMIRRCRDHRRKQWTRYGGRGISVCEEWKSNMDAFIVWAENNGYKEGLTIDRIDNDGNYEPSNCRWTTPAVQCANRNKFKSNKTGYTGLYITSPYIKWVGYVRYHSTRVSRHYNTITGAIAFRNEYITKHKLEEEGYHLTTQTDELDTVAEQYRHACTMKLLEQYEDTEWIGVSRHKGPMESYVCHVQIGVYTNIVYKTPHKNRAMQQRDAYIIKHQLQQKYDPQLNIINQL